MARKERAGKLADPGRAADFRVNPFAGLQVDSVAAGAAPAASPGAPAAPVPAPEAPAGLTPADRELLRAFGGAPAAARGGGAVKPCRGRVRLQVQRKGKGGKTVTRVLGLDDLGLAGQMELARSLRQALGTGAHFADGALELHGDLRERAAAWFRAHDYAID